MSFEPNIQPNWPQWSTQREAIQPQETDQSADECMATNTKPLQPNTHSPLTTTNERTTTSVLWTANNNNSLTD